MDFILRVDLQTVPSKARVYGVAFSHDGQHVAWGGEEAVISLARFAAATDAEEPVAIATNTSYVCDVLFDFVDDDALYASDHDGNVFHVSVAARVIVRQWRAHDAEINTLALHPTKRWLASAGDDARVRVTDLETLDAVCTLSDHTNDVHGLAFSPNGAWLVSGGHDRRLFAYAIDDDRVELRASPSLAYERHIWSAAFNCDSSVLATVGSGLLSLFDVPTFSRRAATNRSQRLLTEVVWVDRARLFVAGTLPGGVSELELWHAGRMQTCCNVPWTHPRTDTIIDVVAFAPSHRFLLMPHCDRSVRVYRFYNVHGESTATAALYRASLKVFAALHRSRLGALVMQRVAEAVAGDAAVLAPLTDGERARIFGAAFVVLAERRTRALIVNTLGGYHQRMAWLRESTPVYMHAQQARIGPV